MANNEPKALVTIRDAVIMPGVWRNFGGRQTDYNKTGKREVNIQLPADVAEALAAEGYNVKTREREDEDADYRIKTIVSFEKKTPQIYLISGGQKTLLSEELIGILDDADIIKADVTLQPSFWDFNGRTGWTLYISKAYITIEQDELDAEYADVPLAHN